MSLIRSLPFPRPPVCPGPTLVTWRYVPPAAPKHSCFTSFSKECESVSSLVFPCFPCILALRGNGRIAWRQITGILLTRNAAAAETPRQRKRCAPHSLPYLDCLARYLPCASPSFCVYRFARVVTRPTPLPVLPAEDRVAKHRRHHHYLQVRPVFGRLQHRAVHGRGGYSLPAVGQA